MHVYEVAPGIYKIFSQNASLKTCRHGYFSKHQNESGYFCGMTLCISIIDKTLRTCVYYHDAFPAFEPKLIFQIQEDQSAIL